jgi:peroxiredoxin
MRKILLVILAVITLSCQNKEGMPQGETVPDFETYNVKGEKVKISDYKGKVVMLYFWADFCPTCKKEFPATDEYYQKLDKNNFELLAVNVGQPKKSSDLFYEKYKPAFPMLLDTAGQISKAFEVKELPTNYFITPDGKIARRIIGYVGENQVQVMINQHKKTK